MTSAGWRKKREPSELMVVTESRFGRLGVVAMAVWADGAMTGSPVMAWYGGPGRGEGLRIPWGVLRNFYGGKVQD